MQKQHTPLETDAINRFFDTIDFEPYHVYPYGSLFELVPEPGLKWLHYHDFLELGRCVKGSGTFCIENEMHKLQAPCYCIIYSGMYHSAQSNPYDKSTWHFLYIDLPYFLSRIDETSKSNLKGLNWKNFSFKTLFSKKQSPIMASIIDVIFEEACAKRENSDEVISGLLLSLLTIHSREMTQNLEQKTENYVIEKIMPAISYIQSNYGEKITIDKLSGLCYISNTSLRNYFHEFAKISPMEYLHLVRIKHSSIMLITTNKQIMEIAYECGYPTISSFNRKFFEYYKISPKEYRKQNKEIK